MLTSTWATGTGLVWGRCHRTAQVYQRTQWRFSKCHSRRTHTMEWRAPSAGLQTWSRCTAEVEKTLKGPIPGSTSTVQTSPVPLCFTVFSACCVCMVCVCVCLCHLLPEPLPPAPIQTDQTAASLHCCVLTCRFRALACQQASSGSNSWWKELRSLFWETERERSHSDTRLTFAARSLLGFSLCDWSNDGGTSP